MGLAPRQWIILLTFYTSYLIFGACVFYHIEHNAETERRAQALKARIEINELLVSFTSPNDIEIQQSVLKEVSSYCNKPVTDYREDEFVDPYQWTFYHAVFFAFIVCSTLGYGNITPSGTVGRYFMIVYALIGMPVNMILYTYLGEYFGRNFIKVYRKYKAYKFARNMHSNQMNESDTPHRWSMICQITISLILPALIILIFLPSLIFTYFEGWDYEISVYYSFVTLLTIGFGDFVPTFQTHQERTFGVYFIFYEIFVLIWFVFGLCYILMLIGFIARGMQSKKVRQFEKQLAENIKLTHNRIWSGVAKDVGYLRRILNEIYIMRVRPVFAEPIDLHINYRMNRSQSCPELTYLSYKSPIPRRKRALSEHFFNEDEYAKEVNSRTLQVQSRHSETNLMRIDKEKTFMQQTIMDNTGELLAQVVFALNNFNPNIEDTAATTAPTNGGINLFSDESILEDEWSVVTAPNDFKSMKNRRVRAKSLHPQISKISNGTEMNAPQFTWSGDNNDIQDYINAQAKIKTKVTRKSKKDNYSTVINIEKSKEIEPHTNRRKSIFTAFNNVFKRRNTTAAVNGDTSPDESDMKIPTPNPTPKATLSPPLNRKSSMKVDSSRKPDYIRRPSILSTQSSNSENVLENTTIADLIRAIENAHVKNMLPKGLDNLTTRRISLAQSARRGSVSFSTPLETPPSAGSNRINLHKSAMMTSHNRIMTMRQHSSPNRFSVTPVSDTPSSVASLSPLIQRRIRRFSAAPSTTIMPHRRLSTSLQATPLAVRRTQFKQTISPLAKQPPQLPSSATEQSTTSSSKKPSISLFSKTLTKSLQPDQNND